MLVVVEDGVLDHLRRVSLPLLQILLEGVEPLELVSGSGSP